MPDSANPSGDLRNQAGAWARHHYGPTVDAGDPVTLDGHSGLTFLIPITLPNGEILDEVVLRLPPAGVKPQRNTDVLRQIPVLTLLAAGEVPVAPVLDPGVDETWFGRPFLVVRRMPGATRSIDDTPELTPGPEHVFEAMDVLGAMHRSVPVDALAGWDEVHSYADELSSWDRALTRMPDPRWLESCTELRDALATVLPANPTSGLVHGDYQFSNLLFTDATISAVLDWEVASLGPQLLDLGWFLTINDQTSWAHPVRTEEIPPADDIVARYAAAAGRTIDPSEVAFARALAAYRFAVIAGLNLGLHRSGRRVDAHWEKIAPSIPKLIESGLSRLS